MVRPSTAALALVVLLSGAGPAAAFQASQEAYIKASNTDPMDWFGEVLALWGDTLVVAAKGEDSASPGIDGDQTDDSNPNAGAVYVFVREAGAWTQQAYIKPDVVSSFDSFGLSVALHADTLVVGAPSFGGGLPGTGIVYVFERTGTTWAQTGTIEPANEALDGFGGTVALEGHTLVVGAPFDDSDADGVDGDPTGGGAPNAGAAYVFERVDGVWVEQAYLKAFPSVEDAYFGSAVDVDGDAVVVGADFENLVSGAVYTYRRDDAGTPGDRSDDGWLAEQRLTEPPGGTGNPGSFGYSVAVDDDTLLVGAPCIDYNFGGDAYLYRHTGQGWSYDRRLVPPVSVGGLIGYAAGVGVALDQDVAVVGLVRDSSAGVGVDDTPFGFGPTAAGSAVVFERTGTTWQDTHYLKAQHPDDNDYFGSAVAVWDGTVAVGTEWEDSGATGIDGDETDESADRAGAVWVFDLDKHWFDLGGGTSGVAGVPTLTGDGPLDAGTTTTIALTRAPPSTPALLWLSFGNAPFDALGGTVYAFPFAKQQFFTTDPLGRISVSVPWPAGVPAGTKFWLQAITQDLTTLPGLTLSNGLRGETP